ncbi:MAG: TetR family transcriptional regulator [Rhizomicrobium sp.]
MTQAIATRRERHTVTRSSILAAARRVAARDGAKDFSLRAVAAEADFVPAALYSYFKSKDELLLALAADDLSGLARAMRQSENGAVSKFSAAAGAALAHLQSSETIVAAASALPSQAGSSDAERLFNGRLIAVLKILSDARGAALDARPSQADAVLLAAALVGLAVFARSGRLAALGFASDELVAALDRRFAI